MPDAERTVNVNVQPSPYEVVVGVGVMDSLGERVRDRLGPRPARAFLIRDDNLPESTVAEAVASLERGGFQIGTASMTALETNKTLRTHEALLAEVLRFKLERHEPVIALGGGIVGDVAGYVGASYRRGVPVVQCPTTLLAMVDASVGGKTGVNLSLDEGGEARLVKNMAGAFWQPELVLADVATLRTLDDRQLRSGLFECVKHALISTGVGSDASLIEWTNGALARVLARDEAALVELIARNVAVKAHVVTRDERESFGGVRALLNLGHTFAHAIEPLPGLSPTGRSEDSPLLHGEAVGFGMLAAAATARALGMIDGAQERSIRALVVGAGLPAERLAGLPADDALLEAMMHDKKVTGRRLRLVLPESIGGGRVVEDPAREAVVAGWAAIRA